MSMTWDRRQYDHERYARKRDEFLAYVGGANPSCVKCGSSESLEFDHVDPASKAFDIGSQWNKPLAFVAGELAKCQLLCSACHTAKSRSEASVGHGGGSSGKKNCRCELCRPLKDNYVRRPHDIAFASPIKTEVHGNQSAYRNGCRCRTCKAGNAARIKAWRDAKRAS